MGEPGATLDPGEDLSRLNRGVGQRPPGNGGTPLSPADDPIRNALTQIGALLTGRAQARFREQKFGGVNWVARKVPNIAGIIADLEVGKNPPSRRWDPRPALQDTGRLKGSITWRLVGDGAVEIGSNLSYAADAQYGAHRVFPLTSRVRDGLLRLAQQGKDPTGELEAIATGDDETYEVDTPERIFVGIDGQDEKDIRTVIERWFSGKPYTLETA